MSTNPEEVPYICTFKRNGCIWHTKTFAEEDHARKYSGMILSGKTRDNSAEISCGGTIVFTAHGSKV